MSDATLTTPRAASIHKTDEAAKRVRARAAADTRLRIYGLMAIGVAVAALVILLWSVFERAWRTTTEHYAVVEMTLSRADVDPENVRAANFSGMVKSELKQAYPSASGRRERKSLYGLISDGAADDLREQAREGTLTFDTPMQRELLLSDDADLYLRGHFGELDTVPGKGTLTMELEGKTVTLAASQGDFAEAIGAVKVQLRKQSERLRRQAARQESGIGVMTERLESLEGEDAEATKAQIAGFTAKRDALIAQADDLDAKIVASSTTPLQLTDRMPSFFVRAKGGILKLIAASSNGAEAQALIPVDTFGEAAPADWSFLRLVEPEAGRTVKDLQVAILEDLRAEGRIVEKANWRFLSKGDSREAELAGIWGAVVGTLLDHAGHVLLAFPDRRAGRDLSGGIRAQEPLHRFHRGEHQQSRRGAVDRRSACLGLGGVCLVFFGVPRSAPLAGGMVLALMTLPTIIIAHARRSARFRPRSATPPWGGRLEAAGDVPSCPAAGDAGNSDRTIIGMAQALGETAPLIMIGMVAFIVDIPQGVTESATVLPVQIYRWSDFPERAFDAKTALAICVLLGFLLLMNILAIVLRKRF